MKLGCFKSKFFYAPKGVWSAQKCAIFEGFSVDKGHGLHVEGGDNRGVSVDNEVKNSGIGRNAGVKGITFRFCGSGGGGGGGTVRFHFVCAGVMGRCAVRTGFEW